MDGKVIFLFTSLFLSLQGQHNEKGFLFYFNFVTMFLSKISILLLFLSFIFFSNANPTSWKIIFIFMKRQNCKESMRNTH